MQKSWLLDCNCLLNPGLNGISVMGFKFEVADLLLKSYMESFPNSRLNVKGFCIGEGVCEEGTIKKKNYLEVYRELVTNYRNESQKFNIDLYLANQLLYGSL